VDLPEHADEFVASIRAERGLSINTARAYRRDLVQYQATLQELGTEPTEDAVRMHLERLRASDLAASSIARKFASIRAYHRFLVAEDLAPSIRRQRWGHPHVRPHCPRR